MAALVHQHMKVNHVDKRIDIIASAIRFGAIVTVMIPTKVNNNFIHY